MTSLPNIFPFFTDGFEHYLTLERVHPTRTYNYLAKGFRDVPVIEVTQHAPKCKNGESWMYAAVPDGARLAGLSNNEKLYVGAQTQDRMFRGDGLAGNNYHHAQMRAGNGLDNPVEYLRPGRRVDIYRIAADVIRIRVLASPELALLEPLLQQPKTAKRHLGWWFEQYALYSEPNDWRWNTAPADRSVAQLLGR